MVKGIVTGLVMAGFVAVVGCEKKTEEQAQTPVAAQAPAAQPAAPAAAPAEGQPAAPAGEQAAAAK